MKIVLASASPRRKQLLSLINNNFIIIPPEIDESVLEFESPENYTYRLADSKAKRIADTIVEDSIIIAADTTVALHKMILGKPESFADAKRMIISLSNNKHKVITGLSIIIKTGNKTTQDTRIETTTVEFKKISITQIESYLNSIHYSDKAGSYAIQENGEAIIKSVKGSISNVVGFPLRLFLNMIMDNSIDKYIF